jgi:DNA-binding CsgD family transcriptional regulator
VLKNKPVAIVSANYLIRAGMKMILTDYFNANQVTGFCHCSCFFKQEHVMTYDVVFIHAEDYVIHHELFNNIRSRLIVFTGESNPSFQHATLSTLDVTMSSSDLIVSLEKMIAGKVRQSIGENSETLSIREIEVLKLIARGLMNKQIAGQLSISTHTVISHRKNITRKLGINTVSGLTVFAMINGFVTSDDLQAVF